MKELIVASILIAICIGQLFTLFRSRQTAVIYYLCVAPLGYFSVWQYGTWDPNRLCGILLILGGLFIFPRARDIPKFMNHRLSLFVIYLSCLTFLLSIFWPTHAVAGRSSVYSSFRAVIQIFDLFILSGAAWQIGIALCQRQTLYKALKLILFFAVLHSLYAFYQIVAYSNGFPATGIRRPYSSVSMESGGEQHAAFYLMGKKVYRAGSLIGEPKHLGAHSVMWISAIMALSFFYRERIKLFLVLCMLLLTLFLTFSTSAWAGFVVMLLVFSWAHKGRHSALFFHSIILLSLLFVSLYAIYLLDLLPPRLHLSDIFAERVVAREYLADMPEVAAKKIMREKPEILLLGTGMGGMSFYIAKEMRISHIILFPNTGLLAYISNFGIIGIVLLFATFWKGLKPTIMPKPYFINDIKILSFIGSVCLFHSFIYEAEISVFTWGFLLAADFLLCSQTSRHKSYTNSCNLHQKIVTITK